MTKVEEVLKLLETAKVPTVETSADLSEDVAKLAGEAVVLLGYKGYSKYLKKSPLRNKLVELGIEVLDHNEVAKYLAKYGAVSERLLYLLGVDTDTDADPDQSSSSDDEVNSQLVSY